MRPFSAADERRISEAIADAERQTSGEIVVVVAVQSDGYYYVPPLVAAIVALFVPWVLIHFSLLDMRSIYLIQLAVFFVLTALLMPAPIRTALVPGRIKHLHAQRRAFEQFLAQNLHTTSGRTGVLLFVSVAERHAQIIADKGIDAKVPRGRGSTSLTTSPPPSVAATRPTALSRPSLPSAPSSRSTFHPALKIPTSCPTT